MRKSPVLATMTTIVAALDDYDEIGEDFGHYPMSEIDTV